MNTGLLKKGYTFYLSKKEGELIGTYIKENSLQIDSLFEISKLELDFLERTIPYIKEKLNHFTTAAFYYDTKRKIFIGEIRHKKFKGAYNEEEYYEIETRVISELGLNLEQLLNKKIYIDNQDEKHSKIQELQTLISTLDADKLQSLIDYANILTSNNDNNKNKQRTLKKQNYWERKINND